MSLGDMAGSAGVVLMLEEPTFSLYSVVLMEFVEKLAWTRLDMLDGESASMNIYKWHILRSPFLAQYFQPCDVYILLKRQHQDYCAGVPLAAVGHELPTIK
jgi:hypothetical protein